MIDFVWRCDFYNGKSPKCQNECDANLSKFKAGDIIYTYIPNVFIKAKRNGEWENCFLREGCWKSIEMKKIRED